MGKQADGWEGRGEGGKERNEEGEMSGRGGGGKKNSMKFGILLADGGRRHEEGAGLIALSGM